MIKNTDTTINENFSVRNLKRSPSFIQVNSIDSKLRKDIWDCIDLHFFPNSFSEISLKPLGWKRDFSIIWSAFTDEPIFKIPDSDDSARQLVWNAIKKLDWYKIYDGIEVISESINRDSYLILEKKINRVLLKNLSAYRLVSGKVIQATGELEIQAIETVLGNSHLDSITQKHLNRALELFSNRNEPDPRNAIKESISAIESYSRSLTGSSSATLSDALKVEPLKTKLHVALASGISKIYAFCGDTGVRHASKETDGDLDSEALFILVFASSLINLMSKLRLDTSTSKDIQN